MRLSDITDDTVLCATAHARYPGAHCAFFGVAGMVPLIRNSYALMVGPAVCLYNAKLNISLRALTSDPRPDNLLLLLLDQHCEEKNVTVVAGDPQSHMAEAYRRLAEAVNAEM
jgi:hypothetical protein